MLRRVVTRTAARARSSTAPRRRSRNCAKSAKMLVDNHGQHAHQLLMRPDAQRELFDTHAGLTELSASVTRVALMA